jgi:hypothetical protein
MKFHWWWILVALAACWLAGWFVTVIFAVFFNPLDSEEDKAKDFRGRLLGHCILNLFLWPAIFSSMWDRRRFLSAIKTGKLPGWIVLAEEEEAGRTWKLSDGTEFNACVGTGNDSSKPADISCDYEDESLSGEIHYRVRMIAPETKPASDWKPLKFVPRGPAPDPDDEEASDDYSDDRYNAKVKLPKGKYQVEFRVPNRLGQIEELSAAILIVADSEDYEF